MLCIKCGASLPEGANFCHMCGKKQIPQKRKPLKRPNGSGTVYKLSGHRKRPWVATKNRVIIGYYEKKTDALQALERLSGVSLSDRFNMTFAEVYAQWSPEHFKTIGPKGVEAYENSFQIFSSLHDTKFRDLRTSNFQEIFFSHWKKSHATLSKYKQLLTQMYSFAIREEIATTNFAKFISLPDQVKKEKEIFSQADIEKTEKRRKRCCQNNSHADWNRYENRRAVFSSSVRLSPDLCDRRIKNRCRPKPHHSHSPGGPGLFCSLCGHCHRPPASLRLLRPAGGR